MRHQVARRDSLARHGIVKLELGDELAHRLIPIELALVHQGPHGRYRERFGDGADGEKRVRRHGQFLVAVPVAVALEKHNLSVLNHGKREPGDLPVFHHAGDELVEAVERLWARRGLLFGPGDDTQHRVPERAGSGPCSPGGSYLHRPNRQAQENYRSELSPHPSLLMSWFNMRTLDACALYPREGARSRRTKFHLFFCKRNGTRTWEKLRFATGG